MHFEAKVFIPVIIFLIIFSCHNAYNQTFTIDADSFLESESVPDDVTGPDELDYGYEPEVITNERIPADMVFVPTDIMYHNLWDTLNIRIGRTDWSKISDSTVLFINNSSLNHFVFPYKGKVISRYGPRGGRFHAGMDVKLDKGDTIVSAFDGKVRIARTISGYGKLIVIRHNNGLETVYGHLSAYLVKVNQEVKAGEPIGLGGRSGRASTDHLHFETRILGEHFNPSKIIDFENHCLKDNVNILDKQLLGFGSKSKSIMDDNSSSGDGKYVRISQGDTLYAIALRHKTTVDKICKLNGITPKKTLKIGSKLRIG